MTNDDRRSESRRRSRLAERVLNAFYEIMDEQGFVALAEVRSRFPDDEYEVERALKLLIKRGHVEKLRIRPLNWTRGRLPYRLTDHGRDELARRAERDAQREIADYQENQ